MKEEHANQILATRVRTIQDPEFPDDPEEKLFFVMVELNIEDIRELKRVTQIELQGALDPEGVKAFVEAGLLRAALTSECGSTCTWKFSHL